jgi:hypothetical protein
MTLAIVNISSRHHGLIASVECFPNKACALDKMAQEEGFEDFRSRCRETGRSPRTEAARYEIEVVSLIGEDA